MINITNISQCIMERLLRAAGFIIVFHHLKNQSVGARLLYLFPSLSGSPVMRGELASTPTSPPPLLTVGVSKLTTVVSGFQAGGGGSLAAFLATSSCANARGSLGTSSPSGVGRGPVGGEHGFLS